jgi:Rps23 Pro-64 3,4-dihydroxylase Tpa1-like proline 4-hydroxylase
VSFSVLNPKVRDDARVLRAQFAAAQPFRHLVVDDLLDPELLRSLVEQFPAFEAKNALNEFGEIGGKAVRADLAQLGPGYAQFDALMQDPAFLSWLSDVTSIPKLLYDAKYVGGGTHENVSGQDLDPHVDFNYHTNGRWHRRLNLILFLNDRWEADWGGCLQLHRNPWLPPSEDETPTVIPKANRAVIFETTEDSWHGFRRIELPENEHGLTRRSVAVYFYTAERPAVQTVPGHGTYYVPRPFPEDVAAGQPLEASQVRELRDLFERRNQQIRYLWESERELREHLERVNRSPSVRLGRALTWPLRRLRDALRGQ